jgi:cyclic pyranopterin phosphate synthase
MTGDVLADSQLADSFGRTARKLRISVIDRCNFRCDFCMPPKPVWLDARELLSFEEMARVTTILARMGVTNVRLSGGEPLVRPRLNELVALLRAIPGIRAVGLTTNGALLKQMAEPLKEAGLHCVTLSLHSLKPGLYHEITGTKDMFGRVMEGLDEARRVGFQRIKINCVVTRGCNDSEIEDFARLAHDTDVTVRFIEYMPFDGTKYWEEARVVSGREVISRIERIFPLIPLEREHGATANHYKFSDGSAGEIGIITSMTRPFCSDCDRIRLKADGKIVPCLFSTREFDLKGMLRGGASDEEIARFLRTSFWLKSEGVETMMKQRVELKRVRPMYTIGG